MAMNAANAAQRKSSSGIADETWRQSICRETYQKHAPVTSSLAATIAAFSIGPRYDGRGVSKSLVTLVLMSRCSFDFVSDHPTSSNRPLGKRPSRPRRCIRNPLNKSSCGRDPFLRRPISKFVRNVEARFDFQHRGITFQNDEAMPYADRDLDHGRAWA